jgi:hypothetical protein
MNYENAFTGHLTCCMVHRRSILLRQRFFAYVARQYSMFFHLTPYT